MVVKTFRSMIEAWGYPRGRFQRRPGMPSSGAQYAMADDPGAVRRQTGEILLQEDRSPGNLIPLLQRVQACFGYLPREAIIELACLLGLPAIDVYGTASFYHQFRFNKPGRHSIRVCTGAACHSRGSGNLVDIWQERLGIRKRQTTSDGKFDLDGVACVGCCVMAPVVIVDGEIHGKSKAADVKAALLYFGWRRPDE